MVLHLFFRLVLPTSFLLLADLLRFFVRATFKTPMLPFAPSLSVFVRNRFKRFRETLSNHRLLTLPIL